MAQIARHFRGAATHLRSLRHGVMLASCASLAMAGGCFFDLNRLDALGPGEAGGQTVDDDNVVASFAQVSIDGLPIRTTAQADGAFVVRNLPEGQWRLVAKNDADGDGWPERAALIGFRIVSTETASGLFGTPVTALSSVDLGQVVLQPTVRVEGEVVDEQELPAADARVVIVQDAIPLTGETELLDTIGLVESRVATGANGEFIVPAVVPGTFEVIAYAERDDGLHMSVPRSITQFAGAADLSGDNWIELLPNSERRAVGFGVFPAPGPDASVVVRFRRGGAGADAPSEERTATRDGDRFVIPDVLVGPWTVRIVVDDGAFLSALESRFVLPGEGVQEFGDFRVLEGACDSCDCDGDGIPGLPQHPAASSRDPECDFSVAEAASIWSTCQDRCRVGVSACLVDGQVFDCEDDLDGQQDVQEPRCYGIDKGGVDCDGDGICEAFDSDDRCAEEPCAPADVIDLCAGSSEYIEPTDGGPVDAGEEDGGFDAGFNGGFDGGFDAGFDGGFDAGVEPEDGGLIDVDGGFDAGVEPEDGGFDAGPALVLPPTYRGDSVSRPVEDLRIEDMVGLNFEQTASVFFTEDDAPSPRRPFCASPRVPGGDAPNEFVVVHAANGECSWVTGIIGGNRFGDSTSIAAGPNGGVFFSTAVSNSATLGVFDDNSPVVRSGISPLALVHYGTTGAVLNDRLIDLPNGMYALGFAKLVHHPLAQGPVLVLGVTNVGDVSSFDLDQIDVPIGEFATLIIFFDETLTATDIVNVGEAGVAPELIAMPSPTRVVVGGGADGVILRERRRRSRSPKALWRKSAQTDQRGPAPSSDLRARSPLASMRLRKSSIWRPIASRSTTGY